ncbi:MULTISPECIES: hypothetical protein [unclassified Candidatus Frackibacter]|uniref:hypothetical protein n=1 Tax=unclassified Candidatus Frackibacter TaxID=2648818 RepID=UPI00088ED64B|nr:MULTISPECIES: hypothetical protein [unclassified Candidatus Frackibacter]SDC69971.1 Iron-sulphur cluster biosynthesis [Candidatus Frackibacter sp. WG11]SEM85493.1 Iron-sulphur cluster biosynthesis [Candidatus Frackibacter sp. WG12]SFL94680.1 Iron-sulphur cluster biosynthesis [Candidatus Frackibacter sp. WG13]
MTLVESKDEDDKVVEVRNLKFVLSEKMEEQLEGATIDYKKSFFGSGFAITGGNQPQGSC